MINEKDRQNKRFLRSFRETDEPDYSDIGNLYTAYDSKVRANSNIIKDKRFYDRKNILSSNEFMKSKEGQIIYFLKEAQNEFQAIKV